MLSAVAGGAQIVTPLSRKTDLFSLSDSEAGTPTLV